MLFLVTVLAVFLILQSCKKSGFSSPESEAQMAEMRLESTREADDAGFRSGTTPLELGQGNAEILKDLEGSVNQRNYPMVGKDQGALDYTKGPITEVEGANAMPIDVNSLLYPIEGYNLLPEFLGESDIGTSEKPLLDLYVPSTVVPSVPMVPSPMMSSSPMMPPSPMMSPSPMMPSSPLLPMMSPSPMMPPMMPSSPMMPPQMPSPKMPSTVISDDIAGPTRPVIGVPGGVVAPI